MTYQYKRFSGSRPCRACGTLFHADHGNQHWCAACKAKASKVRVERANLKASTTRRAKRTCSVCGITGFTPPAAPAYAAASVCSQKCWHVHRAKHCLQCGVLLERKKTHCDLLKYCTVKCWHDHMRASDAAKEQPAPFSRYVAYHCQCGTPLGSRAKRSDARPCAPCKATLHEQRYIAQKARAVAEAHRMHAAEARSVNCDTCECWFSPLRVKGRSNKRCVPCVAANAEAVRRAHKAARNALQRVMTVDRFDPLLVFARDKWTCQLCGVKTSKKLRGTYLPNAPELDHIVPLALGGAHTMTNTQCACRQCNGLKGATARGQLHLL